MNTVFLLQTSKLRVLRPSEWDSTLRGIPNETVPEFCSYESVRLGRRMETVHAGQCYHASQTKEKGENKRRALYGKGTERNIGRLPEYGAAVLSAGLIPS